MTPPPPLSLTTQSGDAAILRTRVLRFCMGLAGIAYLRKTWTSLFQQRDMLRLQGVALHQHHHLQMPSPQQRSVLLSVLKYTFVAQLIAASEYLLPLAKPLLAARIGKLLVWKGSRVEANAKYGPHERNTVDIYGVEHRGDGTAEGSDGSRERKPMIVFVHGGAWSFGHKWQYGLVGEHLSAALGVLVAVVNYRTYPTGHVQHMVEDVEMAVEWVRKNCHLFGGDKNQIFLSGHSSGAHIGALTLIQSAMRVASSDQKNKKYEAVDSVCSFIGLAGPYDISDHYVFESARQFGPLQGVQEISTMKPAVLGIENFHVHSPTVLLAETTVAKQLRLPKFHVLHGLDDTVVPSSASEKLVQNLRRAGQAAEYVDVKNCTHQDIIFAIMGDNVPCRAPVVAHIERIIKRHTAELATRAKAADAKKNSKAAVRSMAKL